MRATTPDAVAVAFGVLDGLGAVEGAAVTVFRVLGDAVVFPALAGECGVFVGLAGACGVFVALAGACGVFVALAGACGVFVALAEALGVFVALGAADAVHEGSPGRLTFQGRGRFASLHQFFLFHESFVALLSALSDRCPPLSGQLVQAMAADGMPTVATAAAAMTIRL
ncbi:hypothetical protein AB0N16_36365 [Streptomyces sp. NPDC051105]|uniref:hypothetical protein n=1 Tax=Streptomyces sp. NPDC051105 TaxID=3154843 RepID=UPI00342DA379